MDPLTKPFAAQLGLMCWPSPGHGGTIWKYLLLEAEWKPRLALEDLRAHGAAWEEALQDARTDVMANVREHFPILSRWVDSIEWLQTVGRGDVVAVMSLHTGAVLTHVCLAWRDDYRDAQQNLWNWQWVFMGADPRRPGRLVETRVDASGAILNSQGNPTARAIVRPTIGAEEARAVVAEWDHHIAPALHGTPPVRTIPLVEAPLDEEAFARECKAILDNTEAP